jgi:hypothetical protein
VVRLPFAKEMGHFTRRLIHFLPLVVLLAAFLALVAPRAAIAEGGGDGCNPGRANDYLTYYFDGVYQYTPNGDVSGGVRADIENYSPFVYNTDTDDSSEWSMLVDSNYDYQQIGWEERAFSQRYTFVEWGKDNGAEGYTDEYFSSDPINSYSEYKVTFHPNTDEYYFYDNGTQKWDQTVSYDTAPSQAQVYDETHTKASQMPGGTGNNNYMNSGNFFYPAGTSGSWHDMAATPSPAPSFAGIVPNHGTTDSYKTWDFACTN